MAFYGYSHSYRPNHDNLKEAFCKACRENDLKQARYILINSSIPIDVGLPIACYHGHLTMVKLLLEFGQMHDNYGFYEACCGGHLHIINYLLEKSVMINWDSALLCACRGRQLHIAKFAIEQGARNFTHGLIEASLFGAMEIVILLLEKGARNVNDISEKITTQLLNHGYNIDNHWTEVIIERKERIHASVKKTLNDMPINGYDVNISNIITSYVGYV